LGFSDASKERINGYGEAVAVWHNVMCEVEWKDNYANVSFLRPEILETRELPPFRVRFSKWVSDIFQPKSYKALRALSSWPFSRRHCAQIYSCRRVVSRRDDD
jgi:hypothetical protein